MRRSPWMRCLPASPFGKLFSSAPWTDNVLFRLCGAYSLQIYVAHCFFTAGFRVLFSAVGGGNFYVSAAANLLLSAILPVVIAVCLNRLGLHDAVFRPAYLVRSLASRGSASAKSQGIHRRATDKGHLWLVVAREPRRLKMAMPACKS